MPYQIPDQLRASFVGVTAYKDDIKSIVDLLKGHCKDVHAIVNKKTGFDTIEEFLDQTAIKKCSELSIYGERPAVDVNFSGHDVSVSFVTYSLENRGMFEVLKDRVAKCQRFPYKGKSRRFSVRWYFAQMAVFVAIIGWYTNIGRSMVQQPAGDWAYIFISSVFLIVTLFQAATYPARSIIFLTRNRHDGGFFVQHSKQLIDRLILLVAAIIIGLVSLYFSFKSKGAP